MSWRTPVRVKNKWDDLSAWRSHKQEHQDLHPENLAGGCFGWGMGWELLGRVTLTVTRFSPGLTGRME